MLLNYIPMMVAVTLPKSIATPFDEVEKSSIAFADVDGDADKDVLITGENNSNQPIAKLYTNDGNGSFTEVPGTPFGGVEDSSIAFADVDGDGNQDVLTTGKNILFISKLYINDGNGNFSDISVTPFDGVSSGSIAFSDVDGDDDEDLLITGRDNTDQGIAKLYNNDGSGNFSEVSGTVFEGVQVVLLPLLMWMMMVMKMC